MIINSVSSLRNRQTTSPYTNLPLSFLHFACACKLGFYHALSATTATNKKRSLLWSAFSVRDSAVADHRRVTAISAMMTGRRARRMSAGRFNSVPSVLKPQDQ
jgi:hypothetical protein